MNREQVDFLVIGAGVIGLAITRSLAEKFPDKVIVNLDRHFKFGQEASSHNSEVIHASIYYPPLSQKAKLCLEGKEMLYKFCDQFQVPYRRTGKLIVAHEESQFADLEKLFKNGQAIGAELKILDTAELRQRHPKVGGLGAIWSPTTGIVDSHQLMQKLKDLGESSGALYLSEHKVTQLHDNEAVVKTKSGEELIIEFSTLFNCAGLASADILKSMDPDSPFSIQACRGRYFSLASRWNNAYEQLIYPMPDPQGGLGVHLTMDLSGRCRLGPDVDWSFKTHRPANDMNLYQFSQNDFSQADAFFNAGKRFLPDLKKEDLAGDYIGVRAKLFQNQVATPEFIFETRSGKKSKSLHFLGIESPGLTAALAIAKKTLELLSQ